MKDVLKIKKFNVEDTRDDNKKQWHEGYNLCIGGQHFYIIEPKMAICKTLRLDSTISRNTTNCDKTCNNNTLINPEDLPFNVQEALLVRIPKSSFLIITQEYVNTKTPWDYIIVPGGKFVSPEIYKKDILLPPMKEVVIVKKSKHGAKKEDYELITIFNVKGEIIEKKEINPVRDRTKYK